MDAKDLRSYNVLRKYKVVSLVNGLLLFKDSGFKGVIRKVRSKHAEKKNGIDGCSNSKNRFSDLQFYVGKIDVVLQSEKDYQLVSEQLSSLSYQFNYFVLNGSKDSEKYQLINRYTFDRIFKSRSFIYVTNKQEYDEFSYCFKVKSSDHVGEAVQNLLNQITGLKLLSNYNTKNHVTVKASTFFNYVGTNYYSGGAERYLIDLHSVCKDMNVNLDIYQNAEKPYFRKYHGINVIGMCLPNMPLNYSLQYLDQQSLNYIYHTKYRSQLHIYSAFQECYPHHIGPSIGISHGVSWDNKLNKAIDGTNFWESKRIFIESAMLCDKLVSVDTNTANWFQTIDYDLGNRKFSVIPNYVDTKEFAPREDFLKKRDKVVITYPRRLYEPRGLYIALDIIDRLFEKYDNVEFHFVGKGFDEDLQNIQKKIDQYPDRIFCYSKSPFEMHEVYKMSDISLVPTQYSEGTSLSCLEAMASGNIVVATRIGGLTDLILNQYNGYLIEPNADALLSTILHILDHYDEQDKIKQRAVESAEAFNKKVWKERWTKVIQSFDLKEHSNNIGLVEFYVEDVSALSEEVIKLIQKHLLEHKLIYIRSKKELKTDSITNGLLQVVGWDDEVVSEAEVVYVESGLTDVDRKEKMVRI